MGKYQSPSLRSGQLSQADPSMVQDQVPLKTLTEV
jgi:hypothetical protein